MVPDWFGLEFAALLVVPQRLAVGRGVYPGSAQRWPSGITAAQPGPSLIWMAPWRGHGGHGETAHGSRNLVARPMALLLFTDHDAWRWRPGTSSRGAAAWPRSNPSNTHREGAFASWPGRGQGNSGVPLDCCPRTARFCPWVKSCLFQELDAINCCRVGNSTVSLDVFGMAKPKARHIELCMIQGRWVPLHWDAI